MQNAIASGYTVIWLLQTDVWYDRNNWEGKLKNLIRFYDQPMIHYIDNGSCYNTYRNQMS